MQEGGVGGAGVGGGGHCACLLRGGWRMERERSIEREVLMVVARLGLRE